MLRSLMACLLLIGTASAAMAAPPPRDAAEKATDPRDKIVCKRFLETGSLVKGQRICKTKAEWQADRDAARQIDLSRSCTEQGGALCR
jgi:hypothetical protein